MFRVVSTSNAIHGESRRLASIFDGPVIRAPALPSVLVFKTLASTDGKAGARIKTSRHHGTLALSLFRVNRYGRPPIVSYDSAHGQ